MEQINFWKLSSANTINAAIQTLPTSKSEKVFDSKGVELEDYRITRVKGEVIDVPSARYVLKQHEEVFRPIIEGVTVSGVKDFKYSLWATNKKANLNIYVGELKDGIRFGFKATNSFDRKSSISYGLRAEREEKGVQIIEKEYVLVWGLRQVCTNGMVIKVPLKSNKYLVAEEVTKVKTLLANYRSIIHTGKKVDEKINEMQYVVEAFLLLRDPMNRMIADSQKMLVGKEKAEKYLEKYVARRQYDKYLEQFGKEEQTLWGLYNAITFVASHEADKSARVREKSLLKAATMLEAELMH